MTDIVYFIFISDECWVSVVQSCVTNWILFNGMENSEPQSRAMSSKFFVLEPYPINLSQTSKVEKQHNSGWALNVFGSIHKHSSPNISSAFRSCVNFSKLRSLAKNTPPTGRVSEGNKKLQKCPAHNNNQIISGTHQFLLTIGLCHIFCWTAAV